MLGGILGEEDEKPEVEAPETAIVGGPRYVRLSRRAVRYHPADLDAWIEKSRRRSTSDDGSSAAGAGAE